MGKPVQLPPILLDPLVLEKPWGGDWLAARLGKTAPPGALLGESWEAASLPGVSSPIRKGPGAGGSLRDLLKGEGEAILGTASPEGDLPLLFKYIHARQDLSLQVHPGAEMALRETGRPAGKTEAWRVLDAEEGGSIWLGLRPGVDREAFEEALARGEALDCLNRHPARPGETYLVRPGCIHTFGGGVLLAEIQEPVDITYRFADWGRKTAEGEEPRPVEPDKAFEAADLAMEGPYLWAPEDGPGGGKVRREVFRCGSFCLEVFQGEGTWEGERPGGFEILSAARGEADVETEGGSVSLHLGETALLPKGKAPLTLSLREALVIRAYLPDGPTASA